MAVRSLIVAHSPGLQFQIKFHLPVTRFVAVGGAAAMHPAENNRPLHIA
jgi:hypothetical protein